MPTRFEEDLNYAIGWNRFSLQILGIWPDTKYTESDPTLSKYWFIVHSFFMFGFITIPQSTYLLMIWGNMELMTEILATANVPITMSCIKLLFARYHLESLRPLLSSFVEDWKRPKSEKERSIMLDNAKKARIISIWCTTLAHSMTSIYIIPRTLMIARMQRDQFEPQNTVVYPAYFPYDISGTIAFCISCFGQIVAAYSATVSYIGVDTFITMLVLHVCAQITNLRHTLENLPNEMANNFTKDIKWIVQRHEHLNWYAKSIENSFNLLMLIQILACIIQVCFQTFQLFRSSGMGTSAYKSQWFNLLPKDSRNIIFVIYRSSIPLCLTAGKFSIFSMEMFSNILKTSIGYLSVLLTVSDNKK
ncbi:PREDICTED: uncharacterized protein LOC107069909 isoform X2 [Polistes dominula]|uniref:Odorant receptor n=1 Tax=Polistes dominula TaxID=743375 RepID=A0ABM1ISD4_POLDO|nr:PREDICTED: uncharacterized protein LOC107069909 isoform X2 [Polistes dominula]